MSGERDLPSMTRRACLKLAIYGAAGLSLLPGRLLGGKAEAAEGGGSPDDSLFAKWRHLGHVWRAMSAHLRKRAYDAEGKRQFDELKTEMAKALAALPASAALRALFEERWAHIDRLRYNMATCYKMAPGGPLPARNAVEQQVKELEQLAADGKLAAEAARKAARVLAVQAEYLARLRAAQRAAGDQYPWQAWGKLYEEYQAGEIEPGPEADGAGKRVAEFTVNRLQWLGPMIVPRPPEATCYMPALPPTERK
jgi:hypothetical protein